MTNLVLNEKMEARLVTPGSASVDRDLELMSSGRGTLKEARACSAVNRDLCRRWALPPRSYRDDDQVRTRLLTDLGWWIRNICVHRRCERWFAVPVPGSWRRPNPPTFHRALADPSLEEGVICPSNRS